MERGINMKKNMRKAISVLLIAIAAVMLLAGCGTKNQETDIEEQTPPEEVVVDEGEPESESSDTLDKTYLLSDLEYMDAGTGEWTPSDFVPGAEKYVFQIEIPYQRIAFLCCQVPVIPATDWLPLEIRGAENRMLMKRDSYCRDIFELSDEEWAFQMDIIWDTCRLTEILNQNDGGTAFIPYIHKLDPSEKADFTKERYWLWDKKQHFDWTNRKRIQFMRDLYENLTVEIPRMKLKNS